MRRMTITISRCCWCLFRRRRIKCTTFFSLPKHKCNEPSALVLCCKISQQFSCFFSSRRSLVFSIFLAFGFNCKPRLARLNRHIHLKNYARTSSSSNNMNNTQRKTKQNETIAANDTERKKKYVNDLFQRIFIIYFFQLSKVYSQEDLCVWTRCTESTNDKRDE